MHIFPNPAQKFSISRNGSTVTSGHSFRSNFIHLKNCCLIGNDCFCLTTMTITVTVAVATARRGMCSERHNADCITEQLG